MVCQKIMLTLHSYLLLSTIAVFYWKMTGTRQLLIETSSTYQTSLQESESTRIDGQMQTNKILRGTS